MRGTQGRAQRRVRRGAEETFQKSLLLRDPCVYLTGDPGFLCVLLLAASASLATCSHASQQGAAPSRRDVPAQPVWTATIETSGGFAGMGAGGIAVTSTGNATVTEPARPGRTDRPAAAGGCRYTVPPAILKRLAEAVTKARPSTWAKSYVRPENPSGCCDQFRYTLALEVGKPGSAPSTVRTFWYDDSTELLPADLRAVLEVVTSVKANAPQGCGGLKIG